MRKAQLSIIIFYCHNLYKYLDDEKKMVDYFTRTTSKGITTAYVTEDKDLARRLRREDAVVPFETISLKDVEARVRFGEPNIEYTEDKRFPYTLISKDVEGLEEYFENTQRILKLGEFHPERVEWEEDRQKLLRRLDE